MIFPFENLGIVGFIGQPFQISLESLMPINRVGHAHQEVGLSNEFKVFSPCFQIRQVPRLPPSPYVTLSLGSKLCHSRQAWQLLMVKLYNLLVWYRVSLRRSRR